LKWFYSGSNRELDHGDAVKSKDLVYVLPCTLRYFLGLAFRNGTGRVILPTYLPTSASEVIADWTLGAKGGKDFWARTELFIDKRRLGEIEPGKCYSPTLTAFEPDVYSYYPHDSGLKNLTSCRNCRK
jgi:hypothetical protein